MSFGEPYVIDVPSANGIVTCIQPSIGDIVRIGETRFFATLSIFITNTTSYRLPLWEQGIDWNELTDYQLFTMLYQGIDDEVASYMFKDLDFKKFKPYTKSIGDEQQLTLYDEESNVEINEEVYGHISQYFRNVFSNKPEEKLTDDNILKQWYIDKDRRQKKIDEEKEANGKSKSSSSLQPIISACVNHPGFKYNWKQLRDVTVYQFYDSVQRLQVYEQTTALMKGMYSGFVDTSKMKSDAYNFMKEII